MPDRIVRFGLFEADLETGELRKAGLRLKIQDQPMLVLTVLLENPGRIVTREELQQRLWPDTAFIDSEHGLNMAVKKLRAALNDSADTPRYVETVARKGYRFIAPLIPQETATVVPVTAETPVESASPAPPAPRRRFLWIAAALPAVGVLALAGWRLRHLPTPVVTPLISVAGAPRDPVFSLPGTEVAYTLEESPGLTRIYVKALGIAPPRRLTDSTERLSETSAQWIPDGSGISFLRANPERGRSLFMVPVTGGTPRKLADLGTCLGYHWSPDATQLVLSITGPEGDAELYVQDRKTGARRMLMQPGAGGVLPRFSPDGRTIAFSRNRSGHVSLMTVPVSGGVPRTINPENLQVSRFEWTPDGRGIIFAAAGEQPFVSLYRISADGGKPPVLLGIGQGAAVGQLAISSSGNRLLYSVPALRNTIWRYMLGTDHKPSDPVAVARSPRLQISPDFSPDGRRITFASDRGGTFQIYVADRNGGNPVQLTALKSGDAGSPRWSPDGKKIAFDGVEGGHKSIYVVDAEGGEPKPVVTGEVDAMMPQWAPDGNWIYYTRSDLKRNTDIWKSPADGGPAVRVTHGGWFGVLVSPDGKTLYLGRQRQEGIMEYPLPDGPVRKLELSGGADLRWTAMGRSGLYYVASLRRLMYYSFSSGQLSEVAVLPGPRQPPAMALSADEKELMVSLDDGRLFTLMLVDNFR